MGEPRFSFREKANAAEREVKKRRLVFPRLVADDKMSQEFADKQIAIMQAIQKDFEELADAEEAAGRLI